MLVYTTAPLEADREVTGPVRLELFASSSAVDTDFTAKLLDVHPDGFSQRLCDSMVRARFRNGYREPESRLVPGEVTAFTIDMWSTSHVFRAGHRIRLEVSSSAFPKYDRNLNTGADIATGTRDGRRRSTRSGTPATTRRTWCCRRYRPAAERRHAPGRAGQPGSGRNRPGA